MIYVHAPHWGYAWNTIRATDSLQSQMVCSETKHTFESLPCRVYWSVLYLRNDIWIVTRQDALGLGLGTVHPSPIGRLDRTALFFRRYTKWWLSDMQLSTVDALLTLLAVLEGSQRRSRTPSYPPDWLEDNQLAWATWASHRPLRAIYTTEAIRKTALSLIGYHSRRQSAFDVTPSLIPDPFQECD